MLKFNRRAHGDFSRINMQAMEFAESLQMLALAGIRDQFGTTALGLDFERGVTQAEFMDALIQAEADGTRDQFEADLGRQFAEMMQQQAQAAAQQQAQGQVQ